MECDVTKDDHIGRVFDEVGKKVRQLHLLLHSVAYAPKDALEGTFLNTKPRRVPRRARCERLSLVALTRGAAPLMTTAAASSP